VRLVHNDDLVAKECHECFNALARNVVAHDHDLSSGELLLARGNVDNAAGWEEQEFV